jgi:hypothetical protein
MAVPRNIYYKYILLKLPGQEISLASPHKLHTGSRGGAFYAPLNAAGNAALLRF